MDKFLCVNLKTSNYNELRIEPKLIILVSIFDPLRLKSWYTLEKTVVYYTSE